MDWPNYVLSLQNNSIQQFRLSGVIPHNMELLVEFFSAKVACKELQLGAVGCIVLVKCSDAGPTISRYCCLVKTNQFMCKCADLYSYSKIRIICIFEFCHAVLSQVKKKCIFIHLTVLQISIIKCTALTPLDSIYSCAQTYKHLAFQFWCCTRNYRIMKCL